MGAGKELGVILAGREGCLGLPLPDGMGEALDRPLSIFSAIRNGSEQSELSRPSNRIGIAAVSICQGYPIHPNSRQFFTRLGGIFQGFLEVLHGKCHYVRGTEAVSDMEGGLWFFPFLAT